MHALLLPIQTSKKKTDECCTHQSAPSVRLPASYSGHSVCLIKIEQSANHVNILVLSGDCPRLLVIVIQSLKANNFLIRNKTIYLLSYLDSNFAGP